MPIRRISGSITVDAQSLDGAIVRLYDASSGELRAETTSVAGAYEFETTDAGVMDSGELFFVTCHDPSDETLRPLAHGPVDPSVEWIPWTPELISTALWLDADDSATITIESGSVSDWADKSGNEKNASQATSDYMPTVSDAALNSKDVISFDGTNDRLGSTFTSTQPVSFFAVAKTNVATGSTGSRQYIFDGSGTNLQRNLLALRGNQTNKPSAWATSWLAHSGSTSTSFALFEATFNSSSSVIGVNGTRVTGDAGTYALAAGLRIGVAYTNDIDFLNGSIAELIAVSGSVSTATRNYIEGYLAHKWGLAGSLPGGHPYGSTPPVV